MKMASRDMESYGVYPRLIKSPQLLMQTDCRLKPLSIAFQSGGCKSSGPDDMGCI